MLMKYFAGLFTTPSCQQERCLDDSIKVKKFEFFVRYFQFSYIFNKEK